VNNQITPNDNSNEETNTFRQLALSDRPFEQTIASQLGGVSVISSVEKQPE
jgi:hypothetical protein